MTDATSALPLVTPELTNAAAGRAASSAPLQPVTAGPAQSARSDGQYSPRAAQSESAPGLDDRQSFAATLDSVQPGTDAAQRIDTVRAPGAANDLSATGADMPAGMPLADIATLVQIPAGGVLPATGIDSPAGGNSLPSAATGSVAAPIAEARFSSAAQPIVIADVTTGTKPAGSAELRQGPTVLNGGLPELAARGAAVGHGPLPAAHMSATERSGDAPRADSLRSGLLESMTVVDDGATLSGQQGDAQSGNTGRQLPDAFLQLVGSERPAPTVATNATAEFSLNGAPASSPIAELPIANATPAAANTVDLLSAQRPLQPLGDQAQWAQGLGQRLLMMADGEVQTARIRLHPENLGQLDVRIEIEGDAARVWFNAHSGQAREAIESALPRLREMFDSSGLDLVRTDVSDGGREFGSDREAVAADGAVPNAEIDPQVAAESGGAHTWTIASNRLVDVYA